MAQQAHPDSASQPTSGTAAGQPKEEDKEAAQTNAFRHSPTVQWISKTTHVDVETTAVTLEYINFAVIFLAVLIPLLKIMPGVLRKRTARLGADLEVAQARTMDANQRLQAVEARLAGLDTEIAAIRKRVEEDMKGDEARMKASIEEESARIVQAAEQEIAVAGALAQRTLRQFAADLAIDRAMTRLTIDADTDRALIAEFEAEFTGGRGKRKGGQN